MSNEIYPLDEWDGCARGKGRSVNQRLAPIFAALADDPDGWEYEVEIYPQGEWRRVLPENWWNNIMQADDLSIFRLVPKRKTITVTIPVPEEIRKADSRDFGPLATSYFRNQQDRDAFVAAIRSAMEGE